MKIITNSETQYISDPKIGLAEYDTERVKIKDFFFKHLQNISQYNRASLSERKVILNPPTIKLNVVNSEDSTKNEIPSWIQHRVQEDLSHFSKSDFSPKNIQKLFGQPLRSFIKFQVLNNQLYFYSKRNYLKTGKRKGEHIKRTIRLFEEVIKRYSIPDVEFIASTSDFTYAPNQPVMYCAAKINNHNLLIPDWDTSTFGLLKHDKDFLNALESESCKWEEKKEMVYWRGVLSDVLRQEHSHWSETLRSRLVLLSLKNPSWLDARLTGVNRARFSKVDPKNLLEVVGEANLLDPEGWIPPKKFLEYKYLIIPDGATCAYSAFYKALLSNSVAFKVESENEQWYFKALKPYVHYVPIASDLSDLEEKFQWAKNNDEIVKKISENATEFVKNNLMKEHIIQYTAHLLKEYAKLQNTKIKRDKNLKKVPKDF